MLKKSFGAFQAPFPSCHINNTDKNHSRYTSSGLNDRDPNTLCTMDPCGEELFLSPLPQPGVGWDVAAMAAHKALGWKVGEFHHVL